MLPVVTGDKFRFCAMNTALRSNGMKSAGKHSAHNHERIAGDRFFRAGIINKNKMESAKAANNSLPVRSPNNVSNAGRYPKIICLIFTVHPPFSLQA